jgi:hypothetical protein
MKQRSVPRALLAIALAVAAYGISGDKDIDQTGRLITILNPAVANKMAPRVPLAPRLKTLDGKTIFMVGINWGGTEAAVSVFEEMQAWFAKNIPGVKTVIRIKKGGYETDDSALWKEIGASKESAAILGVSG